MSLTLLDLSRALSAHQAGRASSTQRQRAEQPTPTPTPTEGRAWGEVEVKGITHDSRAVSPGWMYVALPGRATHGARFIPQAIARGAVAIAAPSEEPRPAELSPEMLGATPVLWLNEPRLEMAWLSEWVWGRPLDQLELVGVTGTNGKTTTTTLLAEILTLADGDVGLLGTIKTRGGGLEATSSMTTLESTALHERFAGFVRSGLKRCVMEVSSIGVSERRVAATRFSRAAFLNLSEDHLDYHGTMERYAEAKLDFLRELLTPGALVVINDDDVLSETACEAARAGGGEVWRLSAARALSDEEAGARGLSVYWRALEMSARGVSGVLVTPRGVLEVRSPLIGDFNAYNVATAAALAASLDVPPALIAQALEHASVPGRMERVLPSRPQREVEVGAGALPTVLVDYAHTPDALERALSSLRAVMSGEGTNNKEGISGEARGRLVCLFGCGGDRDAHKRPLMGEASALADLVILTSDNPRSEPPEQIIEQALKGCLQGGLKPTPLPQEGGVWRQPNRALAIEAAVSLLEPEDVLLIAGKGHERYQEVRGERMPFDDVAHASAALEGWLEARALLSRSLTTERLCEVTSGALVGGAHRPLTGGEIDTRRLKPGGAFFCLQGARDGHEFALSALERGAGAVVTRRGWRPEEREAARLQALLDQGAAWVEVEEPEEALRVFAADHRQRVFTGALVGLTGSNGKTSTKELLASALSQLGPTLATEGNFNNHLGVPLTLLRLRPQHRFAVVEMGMSARGEIAQLAALARPQVGVITTIAAAHLEGLGSLEEIARAKGELFVALAPDQLAVFSSTLPLRDVALEGVQAQELLADALFELREERVSVRGSEATLRRHAPNVQPARDFKLTLALSGHHQLHNARLALVAALAAAERLGHPTSDELVEALCAGLSYCPAPHMRGELLPLPVRGGEARERHQESQQESWLWLDCYNANPQSTLASLKTFWEAGLRGAIVLGALKELGARSDELHRELGREVARLALALEPTPPQPVLTVGDEARFIAEGLREGGYPPQLITHLPPEGITEAQALLCATLNAQPRASLFVKGSRSGRLERLAELVMEQLKAHTLS